MTDTTTGRGPGDLAEVFDEITARVREGLSLRSAAALHSIPHRRLAGWVRLADDGLEPFAGWLLGLCKLCAEDRLISLRGLAQLAAVDAQVWRDYRRMANTVSPLD